MAFSREKLLIFLILSPNLMIGILSASIIKQLPGFVGPLPFHLETGYITVDEASEAELFYYFIESERNPVEDPLLLWLTGGPGCTSFYGLAREIGPIQFKIAPYDGTLPELESNPNAWTKISSIIFLDWPAATGFSFQGNADEYKGDDNQSLKEIYNFLKQWFVDYPHFLSNPFYVAGNSYGGKMVPIVAYNVVEGIKTGVFPSINFKGYICGNPITTSIVDNNSRPPYAHGMGIISDELLHAIESSCPGENYKYPQTAPCLEQINIFKSFMNELMLENFLTPTCESESGRPVLISVPETNSYSSIKLESTELGALPPRPDMDCIAYGSYLAYHWANSNDTRRALHVKEGTVKEWQVCNSEFPYEDRSVHSSVPYHQGVITRGYRSLIFSGDHDIVSPYLGTIEWIGSLNLSILEPWRSWHVNGQVGGYTVRYSNNLTFATVKGGSHQPTMDRAPETAAIFQRWISHMPL